MVKSLPSKPKVGATKDLAQITLLPGDCLEQIPLLKDRSIQAVITSPPYAMQRKRQYGGVLEKDYPKWMVCVFNAIKPKLTKDGSILVNIRSHVKDGAVSDYVLNTRLALREAGFSENEELIWYKPEAGPLGSVMRPRRAWEQILWFSTCKNPFVDLKAAGRVSKNIGFSRTKKATEDYSDLYGGGTGNRRLGIARIEDVFAVPISDNSKRVKHPAAFPPALVERLVLSFTKKGDTILDPFAGSGTTVFVARFLKRHAIGIEKEPEFVDLIRERQNTIDWAAAPPTPNLEWSRQLIEEAAHMGINIHLDFVNGTLSEKNRWKVLDGVRG